MPHNMCVLWLTGISPLLFVDSHCCTICDALLLVDLMLSKLCECLSWNIHGQHVWFSDMSNQGLSTFTCCKIVFKFQFCWTLCFTLSQLSFCTNTKKFEVLKWIFHASLWFTKHQPTAVSISISHLQNRSQKQLDCSHHLPTKFKEQNWKFHSTSLKNDENLCWLWMQHTSQFQSCVKMEKLCFKTLCTRSIHQSRNNRKESKFSGSALCHTPVKWSATVTYLFVYFVLVPYATHSHEQEVATVQFPSKSDWFLIPGVIFVLLLLWHTPGPV